MALSHTCGEISALYHTLENSWPAWTLMPFLASSEGRPVAGHGRCSQQCLGAIESPCSAQPGEARPRPSDPLMLCSWPFLGCGHGATCPCQTCIVGLWRWCEESLGGWCQCLVTYSVSSCCRKAEGKAASTTELPPEYLTSPLSQQSQVRGPSHP